MKKNSITFLALFVILLNIGCAQKKSTGVSYAQPDLEEFFEEKAPQKISDPFEKFNRIVFVFNDGLYEYVINPVSQAYELVLHSKIKTGMRNFFNYLKSPIYLASNMLIGDSEGAAFVLGRTLAHTFVFGLFDFAKIPRNVNKNFCDVFRIWGIPKGPLIVLPLLGPFHTRDAIGTLLGSYANPVNQVNTEWTVPLKFSETLSEWPETYSDYTSMKDSTLDPYTATRSWIMNRE
ncbi:MAG: VacJ family lipoprotein [Candidatus Moranbacteria bacterium]|nr:VacJ family lipoprotein [Candidatus Moranbacteria bacterium]